jgi:hypothetical protein
VARDDRPRGPGAEKRSKAATEQYLRQLDGLFSKAPGGAAGEKLAKALRDAHGTPALAEACRAYRDGIGMPQDAALLSLFLDAGDPEIVCAALEALASAQQAGELRATSGLRTQLRLLAQDPDDGVAEASEALLARL